MYFTFYIYIFRCSYAVVKFPDESGCLSIVPISWLVTTSSGTLCRWPPANVSLKKASKKLANPTDEWKSYKAIPVHYSSKLLSSFFSIQLLTLFESSFRYVDIYNQYIKFVKLI